jgi:hypothetical protein
MNTPSIGHSVSLFKNEELVKIITWAKGERIDKQYYVNAKDEFTLESSKDLFFKAEEFLIEIQLILNTIIFFWPIITFIFINIF